MGLEAVLDLIHLNPRWVFRFEGLVFWAGSGVGVLGHLQTGIGCISFCTSLTFMFSQESTAHTSELCPTLGPDCWIPGFESNPLRKEGCHYLRTMGAGQ